MDNKEQYIIEECRYCGNKTKLDIVAQKLISEEVQYYDEFYKADIDQWLSNTNWMILKCCVCDNISLAKDYVDEILGNYKESDFSIVYPHKTYSSSHMPKEIYSAYEVALKAKNLDFSLCLLSLRRALEIICKLQGETSGNLVTKIENLAKKGILPSVLKDASDLVRILGNIAAHGDQENFSNEQVDSMIKFVESIIEYIYILPENIQKLKNSNT